MRTYRSTLTGVVVTLDDDHAVALGSDYTEVTLDEDLTDADGDPAAAVVALEPAASDGAEQPAPTKPRRRTRKTPTTKAGDVW